MPRPHPPVMLLTLTVTPWWIERQDDFDETNAGLAEVDRALARVVSVIQAHMLRAKIPFETIAVDTQAITVSVFIERIEQIQRIQEAAYAAREELDAMLLRCERCHGIGELSPMARDGGGRIVTGITCPECRGAGLKEPS